MTFTRKRRVNHVVSVFLALTSPLHSLHLCRPRILTPLSRNGQSRVGKGRHPIHPSCGVRPVLSSGTKSEKFSILSSTMTRGSGTIPRGIANSVNSVQSNPQHDGMTDMEKFSMLVATATMAFFFTGLISVSGPGGWRYYLAGGTCAAVSHGITTPIGESSRVLFGFILRLFWLGLFYAFSCTGTFSLRHMILSSLLPPSDVVKVNAKMRNKFTVVITIIVVMNKKLTSSFNLFHR